MLCVFQRWHLSQYRHFSVQYWLHKQRAALPLNMYINAEFTQSAVCLIAVSSGDLQRGKFRPRLQQLVASNSDETVGKCSRKAFSLLPDVRAAIAELSALKGVGPATASGKCNIATAADTSKLDAGRASLLLLFSFPNVQRKQLGHAALWLSATCLLHSYDQLSPNWLSIWFQLCWRQEPQNRLRSCQMKPWRACRAWSPFSTQPSTTTSTWTQWRKRQNNWIKVRLHWPTVLCLRPVLLVQETRGVKVWSNMTLTGVTFGL